MIVHLTRKSRNDKTGPIPVSTTESRSCPTSCVMFKFHICYAKHGPLALHWNQVNDGTRGESWDRFLTDIASLPDDQLWRHNQAGDLPGVGDSLDVAALASLVAANAGKRGFTYTHKPMDSAEARDAIRDANQNGFTINLSADTLADADRLSDLNIGPVVVVVPSDQTTATTTPDGRRVAICPAAITDDKAINCASCGICALPKRKAIIGFPAHGTAKRKASEIARG